MRIFDRKQAPTTPLRTSCLLLALCVALGSTGCATMSRSEKAATACVAADLATTAWGMSEGHAEGNPTVSSLDDWQVIVTNVALHWGLHKLLKRTPRQRASTFWSSYAAIRCGAALHNYGLIEEGSEGEAAAADQ